MLLFPLGFWLSRRLWCPDLRASVMPLAEALRSGQRQALTHPVTLVRDLQENAPRPPSLLSFSPLELPVRHLSVMCDDRRKREGNTASDWKHVSPGTVCFLFYQLKNGQRLFPPLPIIRRSCNKNRKGLNFWAAFDLYCPRTGRSVVKQNWRLIIFAHFERRPLLGAFPVCTVASRHPGHMTFWVLCLDLSVHVMRLQVFHTASGWLGEWNRTKIY